MFWPSGPFSELLRDLIPGFCPRRAAVYSVLVGPVFFVASTAHHPLSYNLFCADPPSTMSFLTRWTCLAVHVWLVFLCSRRFIGSTETSPPSSSHSCLVALSLTLSSNLFLPRHFLVFFDLSPQTPGTSLRLLPPFCRITLSTPHRTFSTCRFHRALLFIFADLFPLPHHLIIHGATPSRPSPPARSPPVQQSQTLPHTCGKGSSANPTLELLST